MSPLFSTSAAAILLLHWPGVAVVIAILVVLVVLIAGPAWLSRIKDPLLEAAIDAFILATCWAMLASDLAKRWQSAEIDAVGLTAPVRFPLLLLYTAALVVGWAYALSRRFRCVRLPAWWVPAYVLLVLGPGAWFCANRLRESTSYLLLFSLQLPVLVAYVWSFRSRAKARTN